MMKWCYRLFSILLLVFGPAALGEYRVFLLEISTPNPDPKLPPIVRTVESNLDPEQYIRYYPLKPNELISYKQTWMCFGRTDNMTPYCPNPKRTPSSAQSPEITTPQK